VKFSIIVFLSEVKNWTSNSSLFKPIIYFVALGGHKDKWHIKNLLKNGFMDSWIHGYAQLPFSKTEWIEFLFVIISYIINIFLLFLFDVSSNIGIIDCCVFVFDEV